MVGFASIAMVIYSMSLLSMTFQQHDPLIRGSYDLKLKIGLAHLWFEEAISGDSSINLDTDVYANIDGALALCRAMLGAGGSEMPQIKPVEDAGAQDNLKILCKQIPQWRDLTAERWADRGRNQPGTEKDQVYDVVFNHIMWLGDQNKQFIDRILAKNRTAVTWINAGIVVLLLLLFNGMAAIVARNFRLVAARNADLERLVQARTAQLAESMAHQKAIVDTAADGIITVDDQGIVKSVNPAAERIFGYGTDEIIGQNVSRLVPQPHSAQHDAYIADYWRAGMATIVGRGRELDGRRKDGSVFPMDLSVSEVLVNNRRLFVGLVRDITQRKQVEEQILFQASMLDQVRNIVVATEADNRIVYWNKYAEICCQWKKEEVMGKSIAEVLVPPAQKPFAERFAGAFSQTGYWEGEFVLQRKDGTTFPAYGISTLIKDAQDNIAGIVGIAIDISRRKQAEEEARQHQAELAHVTRLATLGEMASAMAHEINQPLAAIVNYTRGCMHRLRSGTTDHGQILAAMEQVAVQAERAGKVLHWVRDFVSKREPQWTALSVNDIVRDVIGLAEMEARDKQVVIRLALDDRLPLVAADRIQIEQVLLNLLLNSIEALEGCSGERLVVIQTEGNGDEEIGVAVTDNGKGISAEHCDRLFDAFFTTKPKGMGMGLSISRTIIEAHGGRLWATPNAERGATFRFTLPTTGRVHDGLKTDNLRGR